MQYRSVGDLSTDARSLAASLPADLDFLVGIPRSGLLAATLVALHRNIPVADLDGICEGRVMATGDRYRGPTDLAEMDRVVVLDDTLNTGKTMEAASERIREAEFSGEITFGAVYVTEEGKGAVDHWGEVVPQPRVFEWNLFHHARLRRWAVSFEGVLCDIDRFSVSEGTDILAAEPIVRPTKPIGWVVSCVPHRFREDIRAWLESHDIAYRALATDMIGHERPCLEFKQDAYETSNAELFLEGAASAAEALAEAVGQPVYCLETNRLR